MPEPNLDHVDAAARVTCVKVKPLKGSQTLTVPITKVHKLLSLSELVPANLLEDGGAVVLHVFNPLMSGPPVRTSRGVNLRDASGREPALDALTKAVLECGGAAEEAAADDEDAGDVEDAYLATTIGRGQKKQRPAPSKSNSLLPLLDGRPDAVLEYVKKLALTRSVATSLKRQALSAVVRPAVEGVLGGETLRRQHELGPRFGELSRLQALAHAEQTALLGRIEALRAPVDSLTQQAENRRAVDARIAAACAVELVAAKADLVRLRTQIKSYDEELAEIALDVDGDDDGDDDGPLNDGPLDDGPLAEPDEDEVGDGDVRPLDDADLALLEEFGERVRAVEEDGEDLDDLDDMDEDVLR